MKRYKIKLNDTEVIKTLNEAQVEILKELGISCELQTKFEIVESSPKAAILRTLFNLPLHELKVGFSLPVKFDVGNEGQLRTYVSRQAKKLGFKLRVVKHVDLQCFEIARTA